MGKYVCLLILAVLVSSISQIILKKSASKTYSSILKEYLNIYVITGYGLMVLSTILVILGLKGVPYKNEPIIESLGYIFVMILSNRILGEKITKKKIIGNGLILLGILVYYIWWPRVAHNMGNVLMAVNWTLYMCIFRKICKICWIM